jgi:hypothetical protein
MIHTHRHSSCILSALHVPVFNDNSDTEKLLSMGPKSVKELTLQAGSIVHLAPFSLKHIIVFARA